MNREFWFLRVLPLLWALGNDSPGLQMVSTGVTAGSGACECRIRHPKSFFLFLFPIYCKAL